MAHKKRERIEKEKKRIKRKEPVIHCSKRDSRGRRINGSDPRLGVNEDTRQQGLRRARESLLDYGQ